MTELFLLALKLSVVVLVVAIGLVSKPADLASLWRRPRLLVRSLLAMYVAVPVAVLLLAAAAAPGPRTAAFVLAYLLASGLVTFLYLRARMRPGA